MTQAEQAVRSELVDGVLTVVLDRPERRNALDLAAFRALHAALEAARDDAAVRCVVLTGAGDAFCAGADLSGRSTGDAVQRGAEVLSAANACVRSVVSLPQPVVAAVRGPAAGVGMSLALACDLVLARDDAYLLMAFVKVGLMPDGGATHLVPAAIGRARAGALAMLGERLPAREALAAGLLSEVHPADAFEQRLAEVVRRLADGPPRALALTKAALHASDAALLEAALEREHEGQQSLLGGPENAEGVAAFLERRPPRF